MLRFWTTLVSRAALGILVILNGQAEALARNLFPARQATCCSAKEPAESTEVPAKSCCCECCQPSGQTSDDSKPSASSTQNANNNGTSTDGMSTLNACC